MFRHLLGYEIRLQFKQPTLWVSCVVFFLIGLAFSRISLGGEGIWPTGTYAVTLNISLISLLSPLLVAILAAQTAFRELESGMSPLVEPTPCPARYRLLAQLGGVTISVWFILSLSVVGMAAGSIMTGFFTTGRHLFHPATYLYAYSLLSIPSALLMTTSLFALARVSGSRLAVYLGGLGLYIGYFAIAILGGSPLIAGSEPVGAQQLFTASLLDPFGITAVLQQTYSWTTEQMNYHQISPSGTLLINRLGVTGLALLFGTLVPNIPMRSPMEAQPSKKQLPEIDQEKYTAQPFHFAKQVPAGLSYFAVSIISEIRILLSKLLARRTMVIGIILWIAMALMELRESIGDGPFDTPFYALTGLIIPALFSPMRLTGFLFLIFLASELAWYHRRSGIHPITDALPVTNTMRIGSQIGALTAIVLLLVLLLQLVSIAYQLWNGGIPDLRLYSSLFYLLGVPWIMAGILCVSIQNMAPDKYSGMAITLFMVILPGPLLRNLLDIQSGLVQFGRSPELDYSVFAGFAPFIGAFHWYMVYWTLFCLLIVSLSIGVWRRGTDEGVLARIKDYMRSTSISKFIVPILAALLFSAVGLNIHFATTSAGGPAGGDQTERWKSGYEKTFKSYASLKTPEITGLELFVDLYPDQRRYRLRGQYQLVNRSGRQLDTLLLGWHTGVNEATVTLNGIPPVKRFPRYHQRLFIFPEPLAPGDSVALSFSAEVIQSAFTPYDPNHSIIRNGSFIRLERYLPKPGYDPSLQLKDPTLRTRYRLPAPTNTTSDRKPNTVTFRLVASTVRDQQVVGPGVLRKSWKEGGRRFFRFESRHPVPFRFALASATYRERESEHAGTVVKTLYHERHKMNIPDLEETARKSISSLSHWYGPPAQQLITIAEIPSYHSDGLAATSYPGVIYLREHGGFTGNVQSLRPGSVNYLHRRTIHELAHQWWGERLNPVRSAPGAALLTETMAEYSAAAIMKQIHGDAVFRSLMTYESAQYFRYRTLSGGEPSLLNVTEQTKYLAYFKGPVVLNAVAEIIGRRSLQEILSGFISRYGDQPAIPVFATTFLHYLKEHVDTSYHALLDLWFTETGTYDLRIESATRYTQGGNNRIKVELLLRRIDPGNQLEQRYGNTAEPITLAIYGRDSDSGHLVADRQSVVLEPGRHSLELTTPLRPIRMELDPEVTRLEADRKNNRWEFRP